MEHPVVAAAENVLWEHNTDAAFDQDRVEQDESYRRHMLENGALECPRCGRLTDVEDLEATGGACCGRCAVEANM